MSDQADIKTLQDDAVVLAQAQVARDWNDKMLKWIIGSLLTIILAAGGLYGKWTIDSIHGHDQQLNRMIQHELMRDQNLDILNAKIDLILNHSNLEYNGPGYKRSVDNGKQDPQ